MSSAIQTFTGALVDPLAPDPALIEPEDIAHALAHHCRFGGHSRVFYSVAQHSCVVADAVEARGAGVDEVLSALLHDAAEAYLGDLPHPLKHRSPLGVVFREAEQRLQEAVSERFGLVGRPAGRGAEPLAGQGHQPAVVALPERLGGRHVPAPQGRHPARHRPLG